MHAWSDSLLSPFVFLVIIIVIGITVIFSTCIPLVTAVVKPKPRTLPEAANLLFFAYRLLLPEAANL
jgi:hypothetical protein